MSETSRIVFLINSPAEFVELFEVAKFLSKEDAVETNFVFSGTFAPKDLIAKVSDEISSYRIYNERLQIIAFRARTPSQQPQRPKGQRNTLKRIGKVLLNGSLQIVDWAIWFVSLFLRWTPKKFKRACRSVFYSFYNSIRYFFVVGFRLRNVRTFLRDLNPKVVIAAEGSVPYPITYFFPELKKLGIPSIVIPYTIANWKEYFEAYKVHDLYQTNNIVFPFIKKFDPQLIWRFEGKEVLRIPSYFYLAYKFYGLIPKKPWIICSCPAEVIAVESQFVEDYLLEGGIPGSQIRVMGSANFDNLYLESEQRQARLKFLADKYNLSPGKPIILVSPPPNQEDRIHSGELEFSNYLQLIESFINAVKENSQGINLLFKLHPRLDNSKIAEFEKVLGIRNCSENTSWILPVTDGFVASVSATIRWALALNVPVVNFDVYKYKYGDYEGSKGIETVFTQHDFKLSLQRLESQAVANFSKKSPLLTRNQFWGTIDGEFKNRIKNLVELLIQKPRSSA